MIKLLLATMLVWIWTGLAVADIELQSHVLAAGGGTVDANQHSLSFTIGQPITAVSGGVQHTVHSGFWGPSDTLTDVEDDLPPALPLADVLHPNLPNPFNPATTIRYDLAAEPGPVRLRIYDVTGRLVTTLVDHEQPAGKHSVIWRGESAGGSRVASGIYMAVLETPRVRSTRKMTLLK